MFGICRSFYKMVKGYEWNYVKKLASGKTPSRLKCKSCGHHFKILGNVSACRNFLQSIEEKFPEWALKVKRMHHEGKKKGNTISSSNTKGLGAWTGGDPGEASPLSRGEREGSKGD